MVLLAFAILRATTMAVAAERASPERDITANAAVIRNGAGLVLMQRVEPRSRWSDLRVAEATQQKLHQIAAEPRVASGGAAIALFSGVDKAAKSRAAEVLAAEMKRPLYRVDLAVVVSKYIGETEKNLEQILSRAADQEWVLFFDEADALFGKRTEIRDAHDRYANQEISYLLQRLEKFPGLAILATNQPQAIDPAVLRRIKHVVDFVPSRSN